MSSQKIILADPDLSYLLRLQIRLLEGVNGDAEIEAITDKDYFASYFSVPRDAGCLILCESFYSEELLKHNIDNIVVLTEDLDEQAPEDGKIRRVLKYSSLNQIFNQIKSVLTSRLVIDQKTDAEVLTFYSSSGGTGKTLLSLSMARYLADKHYRVLFINTESIQSFNFYLKDDSTISDRVMMTLETSSASAYDLLRNSIKNEGFSYLPAFPAPLSFYGMGKDFFPPLIHDASVSRNYDYIIVDTDSIFDDATADIIKRSDRVFFVTDPEEQTISTADRFMSAIDKRPGQYVFVRNNYITDGKSETEQLDRMAVDHYVPHFDAAGRELPGIVSQSESMLKMALMIE